MTTSKHRSLALAAIVFWLIVLGYGVRELFADDGDDWKLAYTVLNLALTAAAPLTLVLLASVSRMSARPRLRVAGLAVSALGCALAVVGSWALPVWMTLLGLGFALTAAATSGAARTLIGLVGGGMAAGIAVQFGSLGLGVGEEASGGLALIVATGTVIGGLASGLRHLVEGGRIDNPTTPRGVVPAES